MSGQRPRANLAAGAGRREPLGLVARPWLQELCRRWRRRFPPLRRVEDHACPILRWDAGQVVTAFMERLSCGHLLAPTNRQARRRRCWKCARNLPRDSRAAGRVLVRPGARLRVGGAS